MVLLAIRAVPAAHVLHTRVVLVVHRVPLVPVVPCIRHVRSQVAHHLERPVHAQALARAPALVQAAQDLAVRVLERVAV